ncbi:hypothetical protein [Rhodovibrio sodomensis]|uniref:hypothetical protein n=1 Tax=Rhodovibrio sodomensis TaxID=1088 RepID=UPI001908A0A7|nr:hypothetical protein [Rhodovibrio sodomensis]
MESQSREHTVEGASCPRDPRCPLCLSDRGMVEVHGHVQCLSCGNNVDPCCGGAPLA